MRDDAERVFQDEKGEVLAPGFEYAAIFMALIPSRVLPNGRSVSTSSSYLEKPQVTKGFYSWLGSDFVRLPSLRSRSVGPA